MDAKDFVAYLNTNPDKFIRLLSQVGNLPITNTLSVEIDKLPATTFDKDDNIVAVDLTESVITFKNRYLPNVYNQSSFVLNEVSSIAGYLDSSDANESVYSSIVSMIDIQ